MSRIPPRMAVAETGKPPTIAQQAPIAAKASTYYRVTRFIMAALLFGMGLYFMYDGLVTYPNEESLFQQAQSRHETPTTKHHTEWDIFLQRFLGVVLPPAGIAMLCWALFNSRGAYRLNGTTLSIPGHPPIQLSQLRKLDRRLWDRKGIAIVFYDTGRGALVRFKLDDYIYERDPTDRIFDCIEKQMRGGSSPVAPPK